MLTTTMAPGAMARRTLLAVILCGVAFGSLSAQVSFERLREAASEPQNWLTYSGGYFSNRHSPLTQITPGQRRRARAAVGLPDRSLWTLAGDTTGGRWRHVRHAAA